MAFVNADRVYETTEDTGTGTLELAGAETGYQTFVAGVGTGNTCRYTIVDFNTGDWEIGTGTVTDGSPDTLARSVIKSSNSDALVNFMTGTKHVFCAPDTSLFATFLTALSQDTTPQLGGPLDVNGQIITSASGGDVEIDPDGEGNIILEIDGNNSNSSISIKLVGSEYLAFENNSGLAIRQGGTWHWQDYSVAFDEGIDIATTKGIDLAADAYIVAGSTGSGYGQITAKSAGAWRLEYSGPHVVTGNLYFGTTSGAQMFDSSNVLEIVGANNEDVELLSLGTGLIRIGKYSANAVTVSQNTITADGADSNIALNLEAKGTEPITVNSYIQHATTDADLEIVTNGATGHIKIADQTGVSQSNDDMVLVYRNHSSTLPTDDNMTMAVILEHNSSTSYSTQRPGALEGRFIASGTGGSNRTGDDSPCGVNAYSLIGGSGTWTEVNGLNARGVTSSGSSPTIGTQNAGYFESVGASGTVTTRNAIKIGPVSGATNNWAINNDGGVNCTWGSAQHKNAADPSDAQDLATKNYVDNNTSDGEDLIGSTFSNTIIDGIEVVNAVNYLTVTQSATGDPVLVYVNGTDTDIDLELGAKNAGSVKIADDGSTESTITVSGSSTNIDLNLVSKGTGKVQFNGMDVAGDLGEFTVAGLPSASSWPYFTAIATDASGGRTWVRSDGSNWKVMVVEGATVST